MSSTSSRRSHLLDGDIHGSRGGNKTSLDTTETGDKLRREHFLKPDSDQIDLNVLLDAVLDINDKLRKQEQENHDHDGKSDDDCDKHQSKTSGKHKESRFLHEMLNPGSQIKERHNYSFRNDQVFDIDRENQRLLKEITRRRPQSATTMRTRKFQSTRYEPPRLKTSSEVNRMRLQKRIEQENQVLLRRIQSVKPDKSLNREDILKDHDRLRPSSASNKRCTASSSRPSSSRSRSSRPSSSRPSTSASTSTRTFSSRDYHYGTPDDNASHRSFSTSSQKSSTAERFPKPSWEAGW